MTGENQGKSQFMGSEFYEEKEALNKKNLTCLESLDLL